MSSVTMGILDKCTFFLVQFSLYIHFFELLLLFTLCQLNLKEEQYVSTFVTKHPCLGEILDSS